MASRMQRYYNGEERSKKNQSLYEQINSLGSYTNIEGVIDISSDNEINIDSIQELLSKNKDDSIQPTIEEKEYVEEKVITPTKNYDLKEVLTDAKSKHSDSDVKYRNLKRRQYQVLKKLKEDNPDNEDIDELLNTLALDQSLGDDLGIFDDLKSDTIVGKEASSIKEILDDIKNEPNNEVMNDTENNDNQQEIEEDSETKEYKSDLNNLDKSFYTASFNFSEDDFEDLKSLDENIKTNNKLIRIAITVFSILIAIVLLVLIAKLMF